LFAGIGAYSKALERLNIPHKVVAAVEFDKKTIACYNLIHGTSFEAMDITKLTGEELPDCDMICYSPPCQSFSVAGKNGGVEDSRGTLFWDALRIIKQKKPKYLLMENVKNLTGKKHRNTFYAMLSELEDAGYRNYYGVLNAKDYGIPQNRERVFVVSIRKDIKQEFSFPQSFDNGLRLKNLLESEVDEKYFISDEKCQKLLEELKDKQVSNAIRNGGRGSLDRHSWDLVAIDMKAIYPNSTRGNPYKITGISQCLDHNCNIGVIESPNEINMVGSLDIKGNEQIRRVYSPDVISPTLNTCQGGNLQPKVIVDDTQGFDGVRLYNEYSPSLRSQRSGLKTISNYRIRKLTPLECLRLMGFDDADYEILHNNKISNSQIYKCAGNSIVVNVLEAIFKNLLCPSVEPTSV